VSSACNRCVAACDAERPSARMCTETLVLESSRVPMLSQPDAVADAIRKSGGVI